RSAPCCRGRSGRGTARRRGRGLPDARPRRGLMHETPESRAALQALLDASYASGGEHLLRIHTPDKRLTAEQVAERLQGMVLLALATTTRDGRPIVGAVHSILFRREVR